MSNKNLDIFNGTERFELWRRLGAGGMGVVYEVFDRVRGQRVALKILHNLDASALYRFKREFRSLPDVVHPNLIRFYELFSEEEKWFFTMELVDGVNLLQYVCPKDDVPLEGTDDETKSASPQSAGRILNLPSPERGMPGPPESVVVTEPPEADSEGTEDDRIAVGRSAEPEFDPEATHVDDILSGSIDASFQMGIPQGEESAPVAFSQPRPHIPRVRQAFRQLAEAIVTLHSMGKLHRDIKLANVMVTKQGRVLLLDFGLSTEMEGQADLHAIDGNVTGTVAFMSPEQAAGRPLKPASDWYSVGVMLFKALTGRLPFEGKPIETLMKKQTEEPPNPRMVAPDTPEDLAELCVGLMRRSPEDRPSGTEVLKRLGGDLDRATSVEASIPRSRQSLPFVGRRAHLEALWDAFATTRQGGTVSVFVHGRSGVGKTALVQRFLDDVTERVKEVVILSGRCYEQESVAYKALDTLIDSLSHYLRRLSREVVDELLPRDVHALSQLFPVLKRIEAVAEAPAHPQESLDQPGLRRSAFSALRELLSRIGDRSLLVLSIDDLQWGDLDSAALLSDLLDPPDPPRLLMICSYRSEYATISACLRKLLETETDPEAGADRRLMGVEALTFEEAKGLTLTLMGVSDEGAKSVAEVIAKESGGNPYFVYELVKYLQHGEDLEESSNSTHHVTLEYVLWNRVKHLPAAARRLLEVLAVAGQPLDQIFVLKAAQLGADGFEGLSLLRSRHLVRSSGSGALNKIETYHDRIRETVVKHLGPEELKAYHHDLARVLEEADGSDPEPLAVHFEGAGNPAKAGHYYAESAAAAVAALAFDRAAKLYRRALELSSGDESERRVLRTRLAEALANAGHNVEAAHTYQQAAVGATPEQVLEHQQRAAFQFLSSGHIDEGLLAYGDVLARIGMPMPGTARKALGVMLLSRARLRLRGLRFRRRPESDIAADMLRKIDISRGVAVGIGIVNVIQGMSFQTRSLLLSLRAGEPFRVAIALAWEAVLTACQGVPARKRTAQLIARAQALSREIGHPHAEGMIKLALGAAGYLEGRFLDALEAADQATEIFRHRCTGVMWELDTAQIFGLWTLIDLGRLGELRERFLRLYKEARERGDRYMESTVGVNIGVLSRLAFDEVDLAREQSEDAIGRWSQKGFHVQHMTKLFGDIHLENYKGDGPAAWKRLSEAMPALKASLLLRIQHSRLDFNQLCGRAAAAAAVVSKEPARLLRVAEDHARKLDRERIPWAIAFASLVRAAIATAKRDQERAAVLLRQAAERFNMLDMGLFAAAARRQLGALIGGDEGKSLVTAADDWMLGQSIRNPERMAECFAPAFRGGI